MSSSAVQHLQLAQQHLQQILSQKQQVQEQLAEIESGLRELQTTAKSYKLVGKLLLAAPRETLTAELQQQQEAAAIRLKNLTTQEQKLQQTMADLQKDVVRTFEKKK